MSLDGATMTSKGLLRIGQTLEAGSSTSRWRVETVSATGNASWVSGRHVQREDLGYGIISPRPQLWRAAANRGQGHRRHGRQRAALAERTARGARPPRLLLALRVTHCNTTPRLRDPIMDPARQQWTEVVKRRTTASTQRTSIWKMN